MATASGLNEYDYQNLSNLTMGLKTLDQLELVSKIPIPPEIMEHFKSMLLLHSHTILRSYMQTLTFFFVQFNRY